MPHFLFLATNDFISGNIDIIITIVIGAVSGFLAEFIVPGRGFGVVVTIGIGILGGLLGYYLFKDYLDFTHSVIINEIIRSTAGAMLLCIGLNLILGNRQGKRGKEKDVYDWENE